MAGVLTIVEGESDLGFAQSLITAAGATPGTPLVQRGHGNLDTRLRDHWNQSSNLAPMLILRDLYPPYGDTDCAPGTVDALTDGRLQAHNLCLRIAVQEIEAWAMADASGCAAYFGLKQRLLPAAPDDLPGPKETFISLCRRSSRRVVREGIVPRPGSGITIGPEYVVLLQDYASSWRPDVAAERSPSLARALATMRGYCPTHVGVLSDPNHRLPASSTVLVRG